MQRVTLRGALPPLPARPRRLALAHQRTLLCRAQSSGSRASGAERSWAAAEAVALLGAVSGAAAAIYTGNAKWAYASVCLPVVAWVAGVQKSREIRAVQRQELEEFAGRLETVYKEHSTAAVAEALVQAGRSGQAWASATQLKRVEAKLSAMEGSVLAAGAAAQGAAGAAEAAVERAAREVAREVAVEVQRGVMGPMGQTERTLEGLERTVGALEVQQRESMRKVAGSIRGLLAEVDDAVRAAVRSSVAQGVLPGVASTAAFTADGTGMQGAGLRLAEGDLAALREMVRAELAAGLDRLDEGAAGAVQEAVERATRALADQIAADVVTAELESEQWTALGRRLGALEASLREVPGEIGESIRAELRRGAEAAMGAREGDGAGQEGAWAPDAEWARAVAVDVVRALRETEEAEFAGKAERDGEAAETSDGESKESTVSEEVLAEVRALRAALEAGARTNGGRSEGGASAAASGRDAGPPAAGSGGAPSRALPGGADEPRAFAEWVAEAGGRGSVGADAGVAWDAGPGVELEVAGSRRQEERGREWARGEERRAEARGGAGAGRGDREGREGPWGGAGYEDEDGEEGVVREMARRNGAADAGAGVGETRDYDGAVGASGASAGPERLGEGPEGRVEGRGEGRSPDAWAEGRGAELGVSGEVLDVVEELERARDVEGLVQEGLALLKDGRALLRDPQESGIGAAQSVLAAADLCFEAACRLDPDSAQALGNWGNTLMAMAQAKIRLAQMVRETVEPSQGRRSPAPSPPVPGAKAERAWVRLEEEAAELLTQAGRRFRRVLELDAGDARALTNWGHVLCMRARLTTSRDPATAARLYEAAVEKFTVACEVEGVRDPPLRPLGMALRDLAGLLPQGSLDWAEAMEDAAANLRLALDRTRDDPAAEAALAEIEDELGTRGAAAWKL